LTASNSPAILPDVDWFQSSHPELHFTIQSLKTGIEKNLEFLKRIYSAELIGPVPNLVDTYKLKLNGKEFKARKETVDAIKEVLKRDVLNFEVAWVSVPYVLEGGLDDFRQDQVESYNIGPVVVSTLGIVQRDGVWVVTSVDTSTTNTTSPNEP